jgi:hypothetical protein
VLHAASWVFTSVKVMHVGIQTTTFVAPTTLSAAVVGASTTFPFALHATRVVPVVVGKGVVEAAAVVSVVAVGSAAVAVLGPTVLVGAAGVCFCERRVCCWVCVDRGGFEEVAWAMVTLVVVMVPYM